MVEPNHIPTHSLVCGTDEVGRGPLAGPVVAAAVVAGPDTDHSLLNDSKRLSETAREQAAAMIRATALAVGLGWVWPREIDRLNIHHASLLAMRRAIARLRRRHPELVIGRVLADGRFCPDLEPDGPPCTAIVGGDGIEPAIMAASILAKVTRDRWICDYASQDPRYGLERHKGYPTPAHKAALARFGPGRQHRRSFRGVQAPEAAPLTDRSATDSAQGS